MSDITERYLKNENAKLRDALIHLQKEKDELYSSYVDRYHEIIKSQKATHDQKAITDLAVKGLKEVVGIYKLHEDMSTIMKVTAITTLSEIERLST